MVCYNERGHTLVQSLLQNQAKAFECFGCSHIGRIQLESIVV